MNRVARRAVLLVFACMLQASFAFALPKVAVLDLSVQKGIDPSVIAPVTESVMEEVVGSRAYVVLDRAYIEQVLKEKEFQLSGMVNDTQVAQAGQYLGADYVVAGKIQLVGDTYLVVAKMIEVRTGVIVAQSSEQGEGKLAVLLGLGHAVGRTLAVGSPISPPAPSPGTGAAPVPATRVSADVRIQRLSDSEYAELAALEDPVPPSMICWPSQNVSGRRA